MQKGQNNSALSAKPGQSTSKACKPGQHVINTATYRCVNCGAKYTAPHERFEVSEFRKVILQGHGRAMRQWAYGQQWRTPTVTPDGIRVQPHREYYSEEDAHYVVQMLNARVSP